MNLKIDRILMTILPAIESKGRMGPKNYGPGPEISFLTRPGETRPVGISGRVKLFFEILMGKTVIFS